MQVPDSSDWGRSRSSDRMMSRCYYYLTDMGRTRHPISVICENQSISHSLFSGGWLLEVQVNLAKKEYHVLIWERDREEVIGSFNKFFVHILFCSGVPQFSKKGVGFVAVAGRWDLRSLSIHHACKHTALQEQSGIGTERLNLQAWLQIDIQVS